MPRKKTLKNQNHKGSKGGRSVINPIVAGMTGAAFGASVGVATSTVLNNEDNRRKVGKAIDTVRKQAMNMMDNMNNSQNMQDGRKAAKRVTHRATKKLEGINKKVEDAIDSNA